MKKMYKKTIKRHLVRGGSVEDWMSGEPGRCSNGGRYFLRYRLRDGVLIVRSSYEDADYEEAGESVDDFAEYAHRHWHDQCHFIEGSRFALAD